ncbi:hypothetical protein [Limnobaculum xujianqingii]|uniref:hypothetical protein n=1 Tax=Limnobaculum xujianqingii TaxID=2738837 RepID=UPI00112C94EA|nr:hypothetical protein [Limnobaculum xujianqingii]
MALSLNSELLLDGKIFLALCHSENYLLKIFNERYNRSWSLEKYEILIDECKSDNYVSIAFLPKTKQNVNGVPFEVPVKGIWENGPGIELYISLEDYSLLRFKGMR